MKVHPEKSNQINTGIFKAMCCRRCPNPLKGCGLRLSLPELIPRLIRKNEDASGKAQSNQYGDFQGDVLPPLSQSAKGLWAPLIATGANPAADTQNEDASGKVQSNQYGDSQGDVLAPIEQDNSALQPAAAPDATNGQLASGAVQIS